jgi:hypothetical protein
MNEYEYEHILVSQSYITNIIMYRHMDLSFIAILRLVTLKWFKPVLIKPTHKNEPFVTLPPSLNCSFKRGVYVDLSSYVYTHGTL